MKLTEEKKENILIKIIQAIYLFFIICWIIIVGFDININPVLNILTNIWLIILISIFGLVTIILLVLYRLKFIIIIACVILSIRLLGEIAFWSWLIYGVYKLWLSDEKIGGK